MACLEQQADCISFDQRQLTDSLFGDDTLQLAAFVQCDIHHAVDRAAGDGGDLAAKLVTGTALDGVFALVQHDPGRFDIGLYVFPYV